MADLTPNAATASAARKGIRLYEDGRGGDGLVAATISDARKMASRRSLSERKVRRMPAWFARHETDRKPGWDTPGKETPGYVAWLLWGGDAGRRWATARVKELDKEADVGRSNTAARESRDTITDGDRLLADALLDGVKEYGRFDAETAQYVEAGGKCSGCVFFRGEEYAGPEGCVLVDANVVAGGGCRLGIQGEVPGLAEDEAPGMPEEGSGEVENETSLEDATEDLDEALDLGSADEDDEEESDAGDGGEATPTISISIDIDNGENHNAEGGSKNVNEGDIEIEGASPWRSVERHTDRVSEVEWRDSGAGTNFRTLTGYASVFDVDSDDLGGFVERIAPGAFREALDAGADVRLLYNHDPDTVMARTTNGSLELREDEKGLRMWARVDMSDPDVSRVVGKVRSGLVTQMSFAFAIGEDGDDWTVRDGFPLRTIRNVSGLYDVSAVTYPAYPNGTKVDVMERAIRSGKIEPNVAAVIDPSGGGSSRNSGEALKRLRAKTRSRIAVITFDLSR